MVGCGDRRLTPRLVIITEVIAPYRLPVFNALAQRPELSLNVIFLSENDPSLRDWRVYKEEINFPYEVLPSWRRRIGKFNFLVNRGLSMTLNRIKPDAVLCGGYNYLASWQAAYWSRERSVPLLLWSESTSLDQRRGHSIVEFTKSRFLSLCQAFVVPGKSSLAYLQELGIPERHIFIAPNAVDIDFFSAAADSARRDDAALRARRSLPLRYFLYVGRLVRGKGVFELLDAYDRLGENIRAQVSLVFVGDGPDRAELEERASRIAPNSIRFHGFVHREDLPDFYALSEALIFPTHSDPWGLVVNEAMACAIPVVASNVAGCVADLMVERSNGFVVPPREPDMLASAMQALAKDSALRQTMGARGREKIKAYSPTAWANGVAGAVQSICAGNR